MVRPFVDKMFHIITLTYLPSYTSYKETVPVYVAVTARRSLLDIPRDAGMNLEAHRVSSGGETGHRPWLVMDIKYAAV